jgi:methylmalonyl-CoA mutase cobalamin-binding domain/chain
MDIQNQLIETIRQADRTGANALLKAWTREHDYEHVITEVLEPVLRRVGEEWQTGESFTIAQAYVAAKIMEDILLEVAAHRPQKATPATLKGPIVLGNIEDDYHALGRRMVASFLEGDGWQVRDLGNDVTPAQFVDTALEVGAKVIGASAMVTTTARGIKRLRDEIDHRGLRGKILLAVGGAVFQARPGLVEEVGGDGTASNAMASAQLFDDLWAKAERNGVSS